MNRSVLIAARRSAVAPRGGAFAGLELHELAAPVLQQVLEDAGIAASEVGELIVANALGAGGNPARVIALAAGLPDAVAGLSIDRQCAGGLDAVSLADAMVRSGLHEVVVAGGAESYSRRPLRARTFADGRAPEPYEQAPFTPWPERDPDMAEAAYRLGRKLGIDRAKQDDWAITSHAKALATPVAARAREIVPVAGVEADSFTRALSPRHCQKAPFVAGDITAANMAVAADAAAFVVVVSERVAERLGARAVEIVGGASLGGDPELPGLAPVKAIETVLDKASVVVDQVITAEIMEAFAVQAIACQQGAGLDAGNVNPLGGALARGHPIGASGAILAVSLYHQLTRRNGHGIAAIAAAGGLGTALLCRSAG